MLRLITQRTRAPQLGLICKKSPYPPLVILSKCFSASTTQDGIGNRYISSKSANNYAATGIPMAGLETRAALIGEDQQSLGSDTDAPPSESSSTTGISLINLMQQQQESFLNDIGNLPEEVGMSNYTTFPLSSTIPSTSSSSSSSSSSSAAEAYTLYERQIKVEEKQQEEAIENFEKLIDEAKQGGRATGLKHVQRILLNWYEPLLSEIAAEQRLITGRVTGRDRRAYGPGFLTLNPEKLAVITINSTLNLILRYGNSGVTLTQLSKQLGDEVQSEVLVTNFPKNFALENPTTPVAIPSSEITLKDSREAGKVAKMKWQKDLLKSAGTSQQSIRILMQRIKRLTNSRDDWPTETKVKIGAALISLLLQSAKTSTEPPRPAFIHSLDKISAKGANGLSVKIQGRVKLDPIIFKELTTREGKGEHLLPRFLPMLIPPKPWCNWRGNKGDGSYFRLKAPLMRTYSREQAEALRRANMPDVLNGLDFLGNVPWRINTAVYKVMKQAWEAKDPVGGLPKQDVIPDPLKSDCYRVIKTYKPKYKEIKGDANSNSETSPADSNALEAAITGEEKLEFDERYYKELCKRVKQKNAERHSLICDAKIKFAVAEKFLEDRIYFPSNLDFRGRAYPIPQNLNHLGADMCRGILRFDVAKPLGPDGLRWLKVHLSNLFGYNKVTHDDRVEWVETFMNEVIDSATRPLEGNRWWATAEEPYQALATCMEIHAAIASGNPETYMSSLPVHQDGSCNGLQHYAALGKDKLGGFSVNLINSDHPQDVYSTVLDIVLAKIEADCAISPAAAENDQNLAFRLKNAMLVEGLVNRKVIKQTVMTSVYGVTRVGARSQVMVQLEEKLLLKLAARSDPDFEKDLFSASRYVANLTLDSLQEMFTSARAIMDWLATCASLVSSQGQVMSWVTPLGLPVMQPYRRTGSHAIKTILQTVTLSVEDEALPVSHSRQRTAFPPNFVHSLDASHMLMTSLRMKEHGLTFASVHDSFWTHPADIRKMNSLLRECFVDLYKQPILENLLECLEMRYPEVKFPPIPERGSLDIEQVKDSTYFFH